MTHRFMFEPSSSGTILQLVGPAGPVAVDAWSVCASSGLLPGVDLVRKLAESDAALADGDTVLVDNASIAGLSVREAASLGLPPLADAVARVEAKGVVARPDYHIALSWERTNGQPIIGATRAGAWLAIGDGVRRLPDALFALAEAVDRVNACVADDVGARFVALAGLQDALPPAAADGLVDAHGALAATTVAVADAFSLDAVGEGAALRLVPVLHRAGGDPEERLLAPEEQRAFGEKHFFARADAQPVYALGGQRFVVLQPTLRKALSAVRRLETGRPAMKRAALANPRAFLRDALSEDADEIVVESLFRETAAYSDRVIGLGLWVPRIVPWISLPATDWLGRDGETGGGGASRPKQAVGGVMIGDRKVELSAEQVQTTMTDVERAIGVGDHTVTIMVDGDRLPFPATHESLSQLAKLQAALVKAEATRRNGPGEAAEKEVVLILTNEGEVEHEGDFGVSRPAASTATPPTLATALKPHQTEGLRWLQSAWTSGAPGVLLADDMGLGKTLQGLSFLAWLKLGMDEGAIERAPMLVVAPTGLLANWLAEHDRHLAGARLGRCAKAFGPGLAALKRKAADGRSSLDVSALVGADWALTTYETLRDYDRDFGSLRFATLLFDEAQKIKTPGVRLTDAAKAMNAEFRIAMTGTPVENRLADLWCITDAVQPALLGDLAGFSATYEKEPTAERLAALKATLDTPFGARPAVMLRRIARERLTDLPPVMERPTSTAMPPVQQAAYAAAIDEARSANRPGAMLEALQRLRAISLHGDAGMVGPDDGFIAASARLTSAIATLDEVETGGEAVLIFLDDLDMQSRLAGLLQRRYRLPKAPVLINGTVAGAARQARVEQFQAGSGFGAMILSPRAGGIGLTLTRANHVIHLSRWWNPAVEDQCNGRAIRIGQSRPVTIHTPLSIRSDGAASFDENLNALLERKRKLMRDTLMPSGQNKDADRDELFRETIGA